MDVAHGLLPHQQKALILDLGQISQGLLLQNERPEGVQDRANR